MKGSQCRTRIMAVGLLAFVSLPLAAVSVDAAPSPHIVQSFRARRVVRIRMWAAATTANAGLNFDGYAFGRLVVVVPLGWRVSVEFRNLAPLPHSMVVEPWGETPDLRHPRPAFRGASTPSPYAGTAARRSDAFSFIASRPGRYRLACAVPGHRDLGMWDTLVVSRSAEQATVHIAPARVRA
jgi:hypothetical protein